MKEQKICILWNPKQKTAIVPAILTLGVYGLLTPQHTQWDGTMSELSYEITAGEAEEDQIFVSGLNSKLEYRGFETDSVIQYGGANRFV